VSLTTTVFSQCSTRWFEASPRRAAPKGQTFIYSHSTKPAHQDQRQTSLLVTQVEVRGLEPLASSVRGRRSTRLSYTPGKPVERTTQALEKPP
jgi:hypothetical protein